MSAEQEPSPDAPFFHESSEAVRFWVDVQGRVLAASVSRRALRFRYHAGGEIASPLDTFHSNRPEIEDAVRKRYSQGALEPVMLREFDLRQPDAQGAA